MLGAAGSGNATIQINRDLFATSYVMFMLGFDCNSRHYTWYSKFVKKAPDISVILR